MIDLNILIIKYQSTYFDYALLEIGSVVIEYKMKGRFEINQCFDFTEKNIVILNSTNSAYLPLKGFL